MSNPRADRASHTPPDSTQAWCDLAEVLAVAARILQQDLGTAAESHGLSPAQWNLLSLCARAPIDGWSQSEMAQGLALSPAHVSQLVELLRQSGHLDGRRAPYDRRRQVWQLTTTGRELLARLQTDLNGWSHALDTRVPTPLRQAALECMIPLLELLHGDSNVAPFVSRPTVAPPTVVSRPGAAA